MTRRLYILFAAIPGLVLWIILVVAGYAYLEHRTLEQKRAADYARGVEDGRKAAEQEIASHSCTIYVFGLRPAYEELDHETGLTYKAIAGCCVDDYILGMADGHNERIVQFINTCGPPSYSRKRWEDMLFNLAEYYTKRSVGETPLPVAMNAPPQISPDRICSLSLISDVRLNPNGTQKHLPRLCLARTGLPETTLDFPGYENENVEPVSMFWGPPGSDVVIVHFTWNVPTNPGFGTAVLDLRAGDWLRAERTPSKIFSTRSGIPL